MTAVTPPVRPADPLLRLRKSESFAWKMFENFSEQFIAAFSGKRPIHYGKHGEDQEGIDAYVDLDEGLRWTFQFRQVEEFTASDAITLVAETKYEGQKHFAFVACELGTAVRKYEDELPEWEFWDIRDISLYVRMMPAESGRRLVYQFFGNDWVENFYEGSVIASFVSSKVFFAPRGQRDLLRHDLPLVGRTEHLRQLREFVQSDSAIALIAGRGGIGKSRLLAQLPAIAGAYEVRFATLVELTSDSNSDLPLEPTIIVVDDAHEREDVDVVLEIVKQRPIATKIVLSTRLHAVDQIRSRLSLAGFGLDDILEITPLDELKLEETKELIGEVIGAGHDNLVSVLAGRASDSPVLAVVASRLLRSRGLNPSALANDEDIRFVVFERFREEMLARVVDLDQQLARDLVTLIAAAGPLAIDAARVRHSVAAYFDLEQDELVRAVDDLVAAGILRHRGSRVRVTPEVLADFILERACITKNGNPTGYATRVFQHLRGVAGARLLRNIAEVDWRVKKQSVNARLLEPIWMEILGDFKQAGVIQRQEILEMVEGAAVYQPREALTIAEYAMRHPIGNITPEETRLNFGTELVLGHVAQILRRIAYHSEFVAHAARLLWELGRDDARPTNSLPGHAFRLLCEMAGPRRHKPIDYQLAVVNAATRWFADSDVHDHAHSVLDVMRAALARQSMDTWSEDAGSFKMVAYTIPHDAVVELHERALGVIVECLASDRPKVVLRAAKILIDQARPMANGMLGQTITSEQQAAWKAERIEALRHLKRVAATTTEPVVALEIRNGVEFIARVSEDVDIRGAAGNILAVVAARADVRDVDVLMDSWGHHQRTYDDTGKRDSRKSQELNEERLKAAGTSFIERFKPDDFVRFFNDLALRTRALEAKYSPERLVWQLARLDSSYAASFLRHAFAHPEEPIAAHARDLFMNLTVDAISLAHDAIAVGDRGLACAAGVLISVDRVWTIEEHALFESLVTHPDDAVRAQTLGYLDSPLKHNRELIFKALASIEIGGSVLVARELAELFNEHREPVASLPITTLISIVGKLVDVPELGEYSIEEFISEAFVIAPEVTLDMFLARIERRELHENMSASAVPHEFGVDLQRLAVHPEYREVLRKLRDASRDASIWSGFYVPQLWCGVFDPRSSVARDVLNEWFGSGDAELIRAAGKLLSEVQQDFVFDYRDFVVEILTEAWRVDPDVYDSLASRLFMPGITARNGEHGKPFPQDIELMQKAREAMDSLEPHSPAWRFYESLCELAEGEIESKRIRDEDEEEEYLD